MRPDGIGAGDDGWEVGQFDDHRGGTALDTRAGLLGLLQGARGTQHVGPAHRQHAHGFVAEARVGTGDQGGLAAEIDAGGDLLGGGFRAEGADRHARWTHDGLVLAAAGTECDCSSGGGAADDQLATVEQGP